MGFLSKSLVAVLLALLCCAPAWAGPAMAPEQLRALFLQRIVKYVHWPEAARPAPGRPFVIAAANPAPLRPWFRDADPARFRLVAWPAEDCQVLYLNTDNPREAAAVLQQIGGRPVLTVGENSAFADLGGIISFIPSGSRLRLLANPAAASRAGLGLSARLLELAIVRGAEHGANQRAEVEATADAGPEARP
ncbi:YfiR family protein [Paucidesulfovibrio longus]|uniref:YfiR family protein n=1 Tax=Paucidesulfovibrio longus TaxID=889 RepID=UPI0003B6BD13|nr:YfiR family protein [Paucidesulfovibrio longus]